MIAIDMDTDMQVLPNKLHYLYLQNVRTSFIVK